MKFTAVPDVTEERTKAAEEIKQRQRLRIETEADDFDMSPLELLLTLDEARTASTARSVSEEEYPLLAARITAELDTIKKVALAILGKRNQVAKRIVATRLVSKAKLDKVNSTVSKKQLKELLSDPGGRLT